MSNFFLTFAIATYNRADKVYDLIKTLLSSDISNIEVVVTDNCSTDHTSELLSTINDKRFTLYSNETNIGPTNNWIRAVFNAKGKYVCYVNDKDIIDIEMIPVIIKLLSQNEYAYVLSGDSIDAKYKRGYDSLWFHYFFTHTTGMIFNGELIRQKYQEEQFYKYEPYMSSLDYLARCCMCDGATAKCSIPLWKPAANNYLADNKSHVNLTKNESEFHKHPEQLLFQYKGVAHQIFQTLEFEASEKQRDELHLKILLDFYHHINEYKQYKLNRYICEHYGLKCENVTTREMVEYVRWFFDETTVYLKENNYSHDLIYRWNRKKLLCYLYTVASGIKVNLLSSIKKV